jgi:hypothetical protein
MKLDMNIMPADTTKISFNILELVITILWAGKLELGVTSHIQ